MKILKTVSASLWDYI